MRTFQLALMTGFGVIALLGLIIFSTYKGSGDKELEIVAGGIVIWGVLPQDVFDQTIYEIADNDKRFKQVSYVQKNTETFERELLEAIADETPPDLIVVSSEELYRTMPRINPIPLTVVSERTFTDTYIDGARIFFSNDGMYGIPFAVDPLVLFWNKDLFTTTGLTLPPTTYEDLLRFYIPPLRNVSDDLQISQSAIAMGEFTNITRAKEIFLLLTLQTGGEIVRKSAYDDYTVAFADINQNGTIPGAVAAKFFTQFADPSNAYYTWSKTLPSDQEMFIANRLAMRFGFASEFSTIRSLNPNLNFDIAHVPQNAGSVIKNGYGIFHSFAIPKRAKNPNGSFFVAQTLTDVSVAKSLAGKLGMAPVDRATLALGSEDVVDAIRYRAAIIAKTWPDPNPKESANVLQDMIERILSGRAPVSSAVTDAMRLIAQLFVR